MIIIGIISLSLIIVLAYRISTGINILSLYFFYRYGNKRFGLTYEEAYAFYRVALNNRLKDKMILYSSIKTADRYLAPEILRLRASSMPPDKKNTLIALLFEVRRKMEFAQDKYRPKIDSTIHLQPNQRVEIYLEKVGKFETRVLDLNEKYIAIALPEDEKAANISWKGKKIRVYFWHENDAGYSFYTKVVGDIREGTLKVIYINHSFNLERTQMRRHLRVDVNISASFTSVSEIVSGRTRKYKVVSDRSYNGWIQDISATGLAMRVGGTVKKGTLLKIEFALDKKPHSVIGSVVGISSIPKSTDKILHIKFERIKLETRNEILLIVYNYNKPDLKGQEKVIIPQSGELNQSIKELSKQMEKTRV